MTTRTGIALLLIGLPMLAVASNQPDAPECTRLALKFSASPRSLAISELDLLKTCINDQRLAMEDAERDRQEAQARK